MRDVTLPTLIIVGLAACSESSPPAPPAPPAASTEIVAPAKPPAVQMLAVDTAAIEQYGVGIYQVMPIAESIAKIILAGGNSIQIGEEARRSGVNDLRRSALVKCMNGMTSLAEINRVTKN
jgi:type II secretory ATPase GspE/PulE/Tfp pilus assembly ATPase PilB-like protein